MGYIVDVIFDFIVDFFLSLGNKKKSKNKPEGKGSVVSGTTRVEVKSLEKLNVNLRYADIHVRFGSTTEVQACGHDRYQKGVQVTNEGENLFVTLSNEVIEDLGLNTSCSIINGLLTTERIKNVALPLCRVAITVPKGTNVELNGRPQSFEIEDTSAAISLNLEGQAKGAIGDAKLLTAKLQNQVRVKTDIFTGDIYLDAQDNSGLEGGKIKNYQVTLKLSNQASFIFRSVNSQGLSLNSQNQTRVVLGEGSLGSVKADLQNQAKLDCGAVVNDATATVNDQAKVVFHKVTGKRNFKTLNRLASVDVEVE